MNKLMELVRQVKDAGRINELGVYQPYMPLFIQGGSPVWGIDERELEELLRLIINECKLAVHQDYVVYYEHYKQYKHTPEDVEQAIDKHFGIEDDNK